MDNLDSFTDEALRQLKTPEGRLKEAGALKILEIRKQHPRPTYHQIANMLRVSVGTVFNVVKARTWAWLGGENAGLEE